MNINKIPSELGLPQPTGVNIEQFAQMIQLLSEQQRGGLGQNERPETEKRIIGAMDPVFQKEVLSLITNLWRTRSRIIDPTTNEPKEELAKEDLKKIIRYVDFMMESAKSMGFEVKDRTGEPFSYGMTENVVASQTQDGITSEIIVETLKPTIYWKTQIAQQGEVIIATPKTDK
jgi:hypothetical protein